MAEVTPRQRASAAFSLILNKMPHGVGNVLAEAMGVSPKDLSEIKNKSLEPSLLLLAHLGYKMVPIGAKCMDSVAFEFLTALQARVSRKAPELQWDDSELGGVGDTRPGALD